MRLTRIEDECEKEKSIGKTWLVGGSIFTLLASIVLISYSAYDEFKLSYSFDQGVTQHLERAAHASRIEIAKAEINSAVVFIRNDSRLKQLIDKNASTDDFQSWYKNLEGVQKNIEEISTHATNTDKQILLCSVERSLLSSDWLGRETVNLPYDPDRELDSLLLSLGIGGLCLIFVSFPVLASNLLLD